MSHWAAIPAVEPASSPRGEVYVLHFEPAYRHARHYIGWTLDVPRRVREHELCHHAAGALPAAAVAAGCRLHVAAVVPGSRWLERWLKNRGSAARVCPLCTGRPVPLPEPFEGCSWAR